MVQVHAVDDVSFQTVPKSGYISDRRGVREGDIVNGVYLDHGYCPVPFEEP